MVKPKRTAVGPAWKEASQIPLEPLAETRLPPEMLGSEPVLEDVGHRLGEEGRARWKAGDGEGARVATKQQHLNTQMAAAVCKLLTGALQGDFLPFPTVHGILPARILE